MNTQEKPGKRMYEDQQYSDTDSTSKSKKSKRPRCDSDEYDDQAKPTKPGRRSIRISSDEDSDDLYRKKDGKMYKICLLCGYHNKNNNMARHFVGDKTSVGKRMSYYRFHWNKEEAALGLKITGKITLLKRWPDFFMIKSPTVLTRLPRTSYDEMKEILGWQKTTKSKFNLEKNEWIPKIIQ